MQQGEIVSNDQLKFDYYIARFYVPEIAAAAKPGQFVHVRISENSERILRRPFSIHEVTPDGLLTIVYKIVGHGTRHLASLRPGAVCDVMGPLGTPYSLPAEDEIPVIVAGGYGAAATYMVARDARQKGFFLLGARTADDLILDDRYTELGCDVRIATNDGTRGTPGFVTALLDDVFAKLDGKKCRFYACGPHPMLMALTRILQERNIPGEISLDHLMCCGVGACFACVVKVKADNADGWEYARACKDGPVFLAENVYTE